MGTSIGVYRILSILSSDTTKRVFLASETTSTSSRTVVVKLLTATRLSSAQEQEDFQQEATFLTQLKHVNILPLLDAGVKGKNPYLVMMRAGGVSLRSRLHASPKLSPEEVVQIISQVGVGLRYAHERNILHCAIKPENIFLIAKDHALLADFSLVSLFKEPGMRDSTEFTTALYMAPEQFSGAMSKESDQYALACVAYELLTGRPPFEAPTLSALRKKHELEEPRPLRDLVPEIPVAFEQAVLRALSKDPAARYPDVAAFLRALGEDLEVSDDVKNGRGVTRPLPLLNTGAMYPVAGTLGEPVLATTKWQTLFAQSRRKRPLVFWLAIVLVLSSLAFYSLFLFLPRTIRHEKQPRPPYSTATGVSGVQVSPTATIAGVMPTVISTKTAQGKPTPVPTKNVAPTMIPTTIPTAIPTSPPVTNPTAPPTTAPPAPSGQTVLSGNLTTPSSPVRLSDVGVLDWMYWGYYDASSVNRKTGVSAQISNVSSFSSGQINQYANSPIMFTWTDGVPLSSANALTGIYVTGKLSGFSLSVPASASGRYLRIYVGAYSSQVYLSAKLNGMSVSAAINAGPSDGLQIRAYTLYFSASTANQYLLVSMMILTPYTADGQVCLQAAALY